MAITSRPNLKREWTLLGSPGKSHFVFIFIFDSHHHHHLPWSVITFIIIFECYPHHPHCLPHQTPPPPSSSTAECLESWNNWRQQIRKCRTSARSRSGLITMMIIILSVKMIRKGSNTFVIIDNWYLAITNEMSGDWQWRASAGGE